MSHTEQTHARVADAPLVVAEAVLEHGHQHVRVRARKHKDQHLIKRGAQEKKIMR